MHQVDNKQEFLEVIILFNASPLIGETGIHEVKQGRFFSFGE